MYWTISLRLYAHSLPWCCQENSIFSKRFVSCKFSHQQLEVISDQLVSFNGLFPSEFSRQPGSVFESNRWKATEFRQFLLYTGPIVLKDFLQIEMYEHFLCLSVAMYLLLSDKIEFRNHYANFAKQILQYFVLHSHRF